MNEHNQLVMANVISGVETGGQRYGYGRWNDYTPPYKNTSGEHTCTLGSFQFYGSEARQLCNLIFKTDTNLFRKLDTCSPSIESMLNKDWVGIRWRPSSSQASTLSAIISTEVGIACQKKLFVEIQLNAYVKRAIEFGVKDVKAQMMWVEIQHLGGGNAPKRVFNRCNGNYSVDHILDCLNPKYADYNKYSNPVESKLFWSRHVCCATWIKQYAQDEDGTSTVTTLLVGSNGDAVKDLQEKLLLIGLADCGYYTYINRSGFVDGQFGNKTKKSVLALQKICGLEEDGIFGNASSSALEKLVKSAKESKFNMTAKEFLAVAKKVADEVIGWKYGNAAFLPAIYKNEKLTSCDRFVDTVLWEAGLKDVGNGDVGGLRQYLINKGYTKINSLDKVSAGDIVFLNGHVFIVGNNKGNGLYERYDCGSNTRINSVQPFVEKIIGFVCAYRLPFKTSDSSTDSTKVKLVKSGQVHLNNYINAGLDVDGSYGNATKKAYVKAIQTALNRAYGCNLEVDGELGAKTESALKSHVVKLNTKGDLVTVLSIGLYINGIEPYGFVANEKLINAVKSYQKKYNLDVDGVAGVKTFKSLATVK